MEVSNGCRMLDGKTSFLSFQTDQIDVSQLLNISIDQLAVSMIMLHVFSFLASIRAK